jgi:MipA family protein
LFLPAALYSQRLDYESTWSQGEASLQQFNRNSVFAIANAKATEKDLGPASLKFTRKLLVVVGMATGAAGAFFTGTANAQESPVTTLGIGLAAAPRYEGSRNYQAVPLPILSASRGIFFVDGLEGGIAYNLSPNIRAGLVLAAQFGRDESDGDRLKGLGDIKTTAAYGTFIDWHSGPFDASAEYLQSAHSGYGGTLTLATKYKLKIGARDSVSFGAKTVWANSSSMQTLFGVTSAQADRSVAGLPAYAPSSAFQRVSTSATWVHVLNRSWSVNGTVEVGRLLGDASNSPVVERSGAVFAGVGAAYSF